MKALKGPDRVLTSVTRSLRLITLVRPSNEAEERSKFLAGKSIEPKFIYPRPNLPDVSPLRTMKLSGGYWADQLETQRRRLLRLHSIVSESPHPNLRDFSREVYGSPSQGLQSAARRILANVVWEPKGLVSWEYTKQILEESLTRYGLKEWQVKAAKGDFTAARATERTIFLTPVGNLYEGTAQRLAVHEVAIHALRASNGFSQDLELFGLGMPGYDQTEEGMAVYSELHTGTISEQAVRNYAARVLAVAALDRGWTFRACFESLRELQMREGPAWEATLRAYRGGGVYKDHIYLQGLFEVFTFMNRGGRWKDLLIGKIGLQHLPQVRSDIESGALREAQTIAGFLGDLPSRGPLWKLVEELAGP